MLLISNLPYPAIMLLVLAGKGKDKKKKRAFFRAHSLFPVVISHICFGAVDVFCKRKDLAS